MNDFQSGLVFGACAGAGFTFLVLALHQFLDGHTVVREQVDHPLVQPLDYPID